MHHIKRLACASVLAVSVWMTDCTYVEMPDGLSSPVAETTDRHSTEIKASWEQEMGRVAREGCKLQGLKLVCNW
jgi:hypothetical protein